MTTSHDAGREAVDWSAPIEAVHDDGRVVTMKVAQLNAGAYADNDHWLATADGTRFPGVPGSSWGNWARKDGKLNGQPGWRIRNVAARSIEAGEQTYQSDDRRLFCRYCGRSHIRHLYKAGIGFLCDPGLSSATRPPAQAGAASVEVAADHRAHLIFDKWDKHRDAPTYWSHLPTWVKEYATECVAATERRLSATPAASGEIPGGMVAYGPDHPNYPNAPTDWDGGDVLLEDGTMGDGNVWDHHPSREPSRIIAYISKASAETGGAAVEHGLRNLLANFKEIAAMHRNDQPHYKDGVRQWGDGDLKAIIVTLEGAIAALSAAPSAPATEAGEEDLIELREAAQDLLDLQRHDQRTVGFRQDRWDCLAAILESES